MKHIAVFGEVKIRREYCKKCKCWSLIIKGKRSCCDEEFNINTSDTGIKFKVISEPLHKRKIPSKKEQKEITERQNYKCLYCEFTFGTPLWKEDKKKVIFLKLNWDHFVPYSYSFNNKKVNFVAACHVCNGIKYNKIFDTVEEARTYVIYKRKEKGYKTFEEMPELSKTISAK